MCTMWQFGVLSMPACNVFIGLQRHNVKYAVGVNQCH